MADTVPALRRIRVQTRAAPDEGEGRFEALVSDYSQTYDIGWGWRERILPGAFAESIAANPTIPICWEHDWRGGPIGHGEASETSHGLIVRGELYTDADPTVGRIWRSMQARAVNEWSVAFFPQKIVNTDEEKNTDLIERGDLVEATVCFRGANPGTETLDLRSRPVYIDGGHEAAEREVVRLRRLFSVPDTGLGLISTTSANPVMFTISRTTEPAPRGAVASHSTGTSDGTWDGPQNKANLKNDGDASYYRKAFAWQEDGSDGTKKNQFRFIHHEVSADGNVGAANMTACSTGIGVLNGGRGGTTIPTSDRQGVYNHLKKHLTDGGREAPELQSALVADHIRALVELRRTRSDNPDLDAIARTLDTQIDKLLAALGIADDDSESRSRAHDPMEGKHSHPHPAYGSQGGDETHDHEHSHGGDSSHDHHGEGDNAATDPALLSQLLSSRWGFELLRDLVSGSATSAPTTSAHKEASNA
jgi:HK97 family phage prohead protease